MLRFEEPRGWPLQLAPSLKSFRNGLAPHGVLFNDESDMWEEALDVQNSTVETSVEDREPIELPSDAEISSWRGWELPEQDFGGEFNLEARKRMIEGGRCLLPMLQRYRGAFGKKILEVGAFFVPLVTPDRFAEKEIAWCENDPNVLRWLEQQYGDRATLIEFDLNLLTGNGSRGHGSPLLPNRVLFDGVVVSQVLNYIDYRAFFDFLLRTMGPGGLLFLNNVANYGIPEFFHDARPEDSVHTVAALKERGFEILEQTLIVSPHAEHIQKDERLVVVARAPAFQANNGLAKSASADGKTSLRDSIEASPIESGSPGPVNGKATDAQAILRNYQSLTTSEQEQAVLGMVCESAKAVLEDCHAGPLEAERPLVEQGFDSRTAVALRNLLNEKLGLNLPASLVFDYPTAQKIAAFLLETMGLARTSGCGAPTPSKPVEDEEATALLDEIEALLGDK